MTLDLDYLNIGCGAHFNKRWTNIDFVSQDSNVICHDLSKGIPFPDKSFSVVYASHVLEHFSPSDGKILLNECYRVLKKGGTLRLAVPDLEKIIRSYVLELNRLTNKKGSTLIPLKWLHIELFDQVLRESSGGIMWKFLNDLPIQYRNYIRSRTGWHAQHAFDEIDRVSMQKKIETKEQSLFIRTLRKFKKLIFCKTERNSFLLGFFLSSQEINRISDLSKVFWFKELLIKIILGKDYKCYWIGKFRNSGEIHKSMYDRFLLSELLIDAKFSSLQVQSAFSSNIKNWKDFYLDVDASGKVIKPDSLFMEGVKV